MEKKIIEIIKKHATEENIENNSTLRSLGLDSLDVVEVQIDIENEFDIKFPRDIIEKFTLDLTVFQLVEFSKSIL